MTIRLQSGHSAATTSRGNYTKPLGIGTRMPAMRAGRGDGRRGGMNDDEAWPVDGVSDAARAAAEAAAARGGQRLGDWIEAAIRDAAAKPPATMADIVVAIDALGARIAAAEESTRRAVAPLRDRLARLSQQLAEIEQAMGTADTAEPGGNESGAASNDPADRQ